LTICVFPSEVVVVKVPVVVTELVAVCVAAAVGSLRGAAS